MAKKFIDANELIQNLEASCMPIHEKGISGCLGDNKSIVDVINDQPAAEVQEVRRGKWEDKGICHNYPKDGVNKYHLLICSQCGCMYRARKHESGVLINASYCPNCGARMDGEENG